MSWLNFNDSINNLKGQITNFASNVLAEENEEPAIKNCDYDELKKVCIQQEIEINNLKSANEELKEKNIHQNGPNNVNHTNWDWDTDEQQNAINSSTPTIKQQIKDLEREKTDLTEQLEQLDLENQQNLSKIVNLKDALQEENSELKESYRKLKQQNELISSAEENLKLELKQLQSKYEEISSKRPEDEYCKNYETTLQDNQKLRFELEELKKERSVIESSNTTLQKILEDYKVSSDEDMKKNSENVKRLEGENKIIYNELQKAKETITDYEKKSFEDAENCQKLAHILESYEKQVNSLKEEVQLMKAENEKLEVSASNKDDLSKMYDEIKNNKKTHQEEIASLKNDLDNSNTLISDLQSSNNKLTEENAKRHELENLARNQEIQINSLKSEIEILKTDQQQSDTLDEDNLTKLKMELENTRTNHQNVLLQLHNKYVNILTENIKKFQDCDKPSDFQHCSYEDDPQIADFSKQVENILKILLDFKYKCEALEKKVYDLSEEKTKILTEKNYEIEKLIQNSEILSQEVLMKTQTIKDYENECNEVTKNNELLINELDNYKTNSGLQTISESNEDNMVLLESQLENAQKRIEDLEKIIDDLEKQQEKKSDLESEEQLVNKTKELHITDNDNGEEKDYQVLLNSFDQLQIEYDSLKFDLDTAREDLKLANKENEELKSNLEKVKLDYENTEYQLSENNVNTDSLKEEIEGYKKKLDVLIKENDKLQMLNEELAKNNEDIRTELNIVRGKLVEEEDNRKHFEVQVRNLTEKLQNAKMTETSLKLQYDTVSKEVMALSEAKYNLEVSLNKTNSDLQQFQNNYMEIQKQNGKLMEDYGELRNQSANRENQIKNFEQLIGELQAKLEKYEELAVDENEELLKKLSIDDNAQIIKELKSQLAKYENLAVDENEQLFRNLSINDDNTNQSGKMDVDVKENSKEYEELKQQFNVVVRERDNLQLELNKLSQIQSQFAQTLEKQSFLQQQLQEITISRNDLINIVTTKHQESVAYHKEIQRLQQFLNAETEKCKNFEMQLDQLKANPTLNDAIESKNQEIDKLTDQNNFLREKCEVMAKNLLEEQSKLKQILAERSNPSEKEVALQKKLDRLQTHLIELEEHYTQELLQAEQKNAELQAKVNEIEEREKSSSTMYTSVSIRANQQVESLQNQLQIIVSERDSLRQRISDAEDVNNKQGAALANLQFVLEQFRKDKEKDVHKETERIRRQINTEKQVQEELRREIASLKSQLEESKQGLQAAARLSDQLEYSKKLVGSLKEEVAELQEKLLKSEEKLKNVASQTDGKVDKSLLKNLIIGFVSSNNNNNLSKDQMQILKIIATVLDFNQQDHDKVNINRPQQGSWLSSLLSPQSGTQSLSQESLSQAFIKFLENESKPRVVPSLLQASTSQPVESPQSSKSGSRQSPIVLSEIVLPTFADFAQNRNSSSILKDVLKDNS